MTPKSAAQSSDELAAYLVAHVFTHGPMVTLHICCNDAENGAFEGKAECVEFAYGDYDDVLRFTPNFAFWAPRLTVDWKNKWLRIGGSRRIAYKAHATHVGSWCFDCFKVSREDAAWLAAWTKFQKWFSLEEGPTEVFDLFHPQPSVIAAREGKGTQ